MIVADTSFVVEALLKRREDLAEQILVPELALYEVANVLWKHQHVLKDIAKGEAYLSVLYDLVDAGRIVVLSPNQKLMAESYELASRHRISVYDAVFISLALELGLALQSFDRSQVRVFKSEGGLAE